MRVFLILLCLSIVFSSCSSQIADKEILAQLFIPEGRQNVSCVIRVLSDGYIQVAMGGRTFPGFKIKDPAEYEKIIKVFSKNRERIEDLIEKVKSESIPTKNFAGLREGGIEVFLTIGENVYRYLYGYRYDTDNLQNVDVKVLTDTIMGLLPKKVRTMYFFDEDK